MVNPRKVKTRASRRKPLTGKDKETLPTSPVENRNIPGNFISGLSRKNGVAVKSRSTRDGAAISAADRTLLMISGCNRALVRATTETELLNSICRNIVRIGAYPLTWVGFQDATTPGLLRMAAHEESDDAIRGIAEKLCLLAGGKEGPAGNALRIRQPFVINDLGGKEMSCNCRREALRRGYRSVLLLPLLADGDTLGVIAIYACKTDAFDGQEVKLLEELAGDLAFGITALRVRAKRDQVEAALRENEERYRVLVESAPTGIFINIDDRYAYANSEFCRIVGAISPDQLLGMSIFDRIHPDFHEAVCQRIKSLQSTDSMSPLMDLRYLRLDGSPVEVETTATAIMFHGKRGCQVFVNDITRRKSTELSLRQAHARLRKFVDSNIVGIAIAKADGTIVDANDYYLRVIGYTRKEFEEGKVDWRNVTPSEWLDTDEKAIAELRKRGTCTPYEKEYQRRDGTRVSVLLADAILPGPEEQIAAFVLDITDRKKAEAKLRESEEQYRSLFENMTNGFAYCRMEYEDGRPSDFTYLAVNDAFERQTGLINVTGRKVSEVIPGIRESDPALFERYGRVARTGLPDRFEVYVEALAMWFDISVYRPKKDHFVAVFEVISARKQVEASLAAAAAQKQLALKAARMGWWHYNPVTKIAEYDERYCEIFGVSGRQSPNDEILKLLHPDDLPRVLKAVDAALDPANPKPYAIEYRVNRPDGAMRWVEAYLLSVFEGVGAYWKATCFLGTAVDITEHKQAEAERERLSAAIEQAAEVVVITDMAGTIQYVNPAFTRVTGYSREEAVGQNPKILKSGRHDAAFYRHLRTTLASGKTWEGRFINRRKDGTLYTEEAAISPVFGADGAVANYVAVKRDITHEIDLETQLRQSQKMEAVGRLSGGVAHDFNNLLTAIIGYSEITLAAMPKGNPLRLHVEEVRKAGERAASLTRQLLAFSRKQMLQPQILNLNDIVSNMRNMLHRIIGENISMAADLDPDLWPVKTDPGQIEQVITNLAVNSRDAMPNGGVLTCQTMNVELDREYADRHLEMSPGQYVMLAVSDTGEGMSEDVKSHIFEPFFTTKEQGKGTGLGLATVYGIVKQSCGHIAVYSELGQGTVFKIYLPRADETAETAVETETSAELPRGSEAILLAEDEEQIRELTREILENCGYTVFMACNGSEALELATKHTGKIQLLLTDLIMPQMGGEMLAPLFQKLNPEARVIYMSGYTDTQITRKQILSATHFLQKPFSREGLAQTIRKVLDTPLQKSN